MQTFSFRNWEFGKIVVENINWKIISYKLLVLEIDSLWKFSWENAWLQSVSIRISSFKRLVEQLTTVKMLLKNYMRISQLYLVCFFSCPSSISFHGSRFSSSLFVFLQLLYYLLKKCKKCTSLTAGCWQVIFYSILDTSYRLLIAFFSSFNAWFPNMKP